MDIKAVPLCWKKSLEFFKKDNLKLYLLLTLNTVVRSIKILVRNFWWLLVLDLISVWLLQIPNLITIFFNTLLLYATVLTTRSSVEAKDWRYYLAYLPSIWVVMLFFALGLFVGNIFAFALLPTLFFFFDSDRSLCSFFTSLTQSFKALVCFAPIFGALLILPIVCAFLWSVIIWAIFTSPSTLFNYTLFRMVTLGLLYLFFDLLVIANISSMAVLYTKLKHENFNLLFQ